MINLLADERKDDIKAARANVLLVRYTIIVALALAFICGALYVSYMTLQVTKQYNEDIIASSDVKADVYKETSQQVAELSSKLSDAKLTLDQEIRYSTILTRIGQLMPQGTVLDKFTLTSSSFSGTPTEITAYAKTTAEASTLQSQFQHSSLFSQVALKGTEDNAGIDEYPVKITLTLVINRTGV